MLETGMSGLTSGDGKRDDALPSAPALVLDSTMHWGRRGLVRGGHGADQRIHTPGRTRIGKMLRTGLHCDGLDLTCQTKWIGRKLSDTSRQARSHAHEIRKARTV